MKPQIVLRALLILATASVYALPQEKPANPPGLPASSQKPGSSDKPAAPPAPAPSAKPPPPPLPPPPPPPPPSPSQPPQPAAAPPPAPKDPSPKPKDPPPKPKDDLAQTPSTKGTPTSKSAPSPSSSSPAEKSGGSSWGSNVFTAPTDGDIDISGPVKVTWTPGTKGSVTLSLVKSSDRQKQVSVVAASIDNSGSYTWKPPSTIKPLSATEQYLFRIKDDNKGTTNYSLAFAIKGADGKSATKITSASSKTSDQSATVSGGQPETKNANSGGSNIGLIAGVLGGVIVAIGLCVAGGLAYVRRQRRMKTKIAARASGMQRVEREYTEYMKALEGGDDIKAHGAWNSPAAAHLPKEDPVDVYGRTRGMVNAF